MKLRLTRLLFILAFGCVQCLVGQTASSGGAISVDGRGIASVLVTDSTVSANPATQKAGGLFIQSLVDSSSIDNCTFSNNLSPSGGGIFVQVIDKMQFSIQNCRFLQNNSTGSSGGGILQQGTEVRVQLSDNSFDGNHGQCCFAGPDLSNDGGGCLDISAGYGTGY
jgi:predicted outer membrane repeat protein